MTKKDTIYIDNQDDITAIIEKVKASKSKVVALVPPKRSTVLESIVNVKLLKKISNDSHKQLVLVSKDKKIAALAGAVGLYVAENLKAKPEVPDVKNPKSHDEIEIDASDTEDIDIESHVQTAVGDLDDDDESKDTDAEEKDTETEAETPKKESKKSETKSESKKATPAKSKSKKSAPLKKKKIKVPDFETFRTKLILVFGLLIVLAGLAWWALTILPSANIELYAQTTPIDTKFSFTADATRGVDDLANQAIAARQSEVKKTVTEQFIPTGKKDVGERATGVVTLTNCEDSTGFTLTAGSTLTHNASGRNFISAVDVFVPGSNFSGGGTVCDESGFANVGVSAAESGDEFNVAAGSYSIASLGQVIASGASMTGGTSETLAIVSQSDIDGALEKLLQANDESVKTELRADFGEDVYILEDSFTKSSSGLNSVPALDEEASSGQVSVTLNYSMLGVPTNSLNQLLDQTQVSTLDETKNIIENGFETASIDVLDDDSAKTMEFELSTRAFVGPNLNFDDLKQQIQGKRFSETKQTLESIEGINRVEVDYSPFWVSKTPKPEKTILDLVISERQ